MGHLDFYLLFLPRSGSHMLVDALNSHPELDCSHTDGGHVGKGDIKGHARTSVTRHVKKALVLTRNSKGRMDSLCTDILEQFGSNHIYSPAQIHRKHPERAQSRYEINAIRGQKFKESCGKLPETLFLSYEELTGDKEIRKIPEKWANRICDFLGVSRKELTTSLCKPTVIE